MGTRAVARLLGTKSYNLLAAIHREKMPPPAKTESGEYHWSAQDIERARAALNTDLRRKQEVASA